MVSLEFLSDIILPDLKDRRGYSHLKEEALDRTMWRHCFGGGFGPVVRQNTEWMNFNGFVCFRNLVIPNLAVRSISRTHLRHTVPGQEIFVSVSPLTSRSLGMEFFLTLYTSRRGTVIVVHTGKHQIVQWHWVVDYEQHSKKQRCPYSQDLSVGIKEDRTFNPYAANVENMVSS